MSLICPVCFWEDDAFVGNRLDERSLCNKLTLREARANFEAIGACDREGLKHVAQRDKRSSFILKPYPEEPAGS